MFRHSTVADNMLDKRHNLRQPSSRTKYSYQEYPYITYF